MLGGTLPPSSQMIEMIFECVLIWLKASLTLHSTQDLYRQVGHLAQGADQALDLKPLPQPPPSQCLEPDVVLLA